MTEVRSQQKRLQRTGGGTPYVYLPKDWTNSLFPNERIVLKKLPIGVLISPVAPPAASAEYQVNSDSPEEIKEAILSAYTQGHREVRVKYPRMDSQARPSVSQFSSRLTGVVSEMGVDEVRIREYTELEDVDFSLLLEGLFAKCEEMATASRDLLQSATHSEERQEARLGALREIEDDADFLSFGLFRLLSSRSRYAETPGEELVHLLFYAIVNYAAERYCDSFQGMADAYAALLTEKDMETASVAETMGDLAFIPDRSVEFLREARKVVLTRDGRRGFALRRRIRSERRERWEAGVSNALHSASSVPNLPVGSLYAATQVGSRLLESGTYLESFCSRTSQFYFAGPPVIGEFDDSERR